MALLNAIGNKRVYLDTNVFIYALEAYAPFVTELTTLDRQQAYEQAVQDSIGLEVFPISREVLCDAARLLAELGVRLPDAIHLATAVQNGCAIFLTNDRKLKCPSGVELLHLSAMVS